MEEWGKRLAWLVGKVMTRLFSSKNSNRRVKRTLHLPVPNPSPTRCHQRPSRSQPPLPPSLLLLPQRRRMKGTRSWQSSRLDAHVHLSSHTLLHTPSNVNKNNQLVYCLLVLFDFFIAGVGLSFLPLVVVFLEKGWALTAAKGVNYLILIVTLSRVGFYSSDKGEGTQTSFLLKILVPISPSLFFTLQVFQKCTVKDVGVKNLVEPTSQIEPQIRELRPGALLPLKEKKVKYTSPCSYPPNCLPLPTVWYNGWLCLNPSTTSAPLLWLERNL